MSKRGIREILLLSWLLILLAFSVVISYPPVILIFPLTLILEGVIRGLKQIPLVWAMTLVGCYQMYLSYY